MKNWNPALNFVMKIKRDYLNTFGQIKEYNLKNWIEELDRNEYNNFASCVTLNHRPDKPWVLIKYSMINVDRNMWTNQDSIYRECRSVVINLEDEDLVLVPFRKFFNLNEVVETQFDVVKNKIMTAKSVEITDKLDGSMQSARYYKDTIVMSGSSAIDPVNSWRLEDGYAMLTSNHIQMLKDNPDLTFIFEFISLKDSHVVKYTPQDEGLYLIGVRSVVNGMQLSYKHVQELAQHYDVPMTKLETGSLDELLEKAKQYTSDQKEGWVLNIDGLMIKLKCDDYVNIHRVLSKVSSINLIIQSIADGTYDDLVSKVPALYRDRVQVAANAIYNYIRTAEEEINIWYKKAPKSVKKERKNFMIWVDQTVPKHLKGYIRSKYLGQEYNVIKAGNPKAPKYKKANEMGLDINYSAIFGEE
jgi:hypothetical protein